MRDTAQMFNKKFFGRRKGPKMTETKKTNAESSLVTLKLNLPEAGFIDFGIIFPDKKYICLEIGFGMGEHLAHQAISNPDIGFIGCEAYENGVASLVGHINDNSIDNIRIWNDDVFQLLPYISDESITRVWLLFPDPWPKKKHHKRRFVSRDNMKEISRVLGKSNPFVETNGDFIYASDHEGYVEWTFDIMASMDDLFKANFTSQDDCYNPPKGWTKTRYQQKAEGQNIRCRWLHYQRK